MTVYLTEEQIEAALRLPRLAAGLEKYLWLQAHRDACDVRSDSEFRRRFNGFYRVRRSEDWQDNFYDLLERKKDQTVSFVDVLEALRRTTGRYEASLGTGRHLVRRFREEYPTASITEIKMVDLVLWQTRPNA